MQRYHINLHVTFTPHPSHGMFLHGIVSLVYLSMYAET